MSGADHGGTIDGAPPGLKMVWTGRLRSFLTPRPASPGLALCCFAPPAVSLRFASGFACAIAPWQYLAPQHPVGPPASAEALTRRPRLGGSPFGLRSLRSLRPKRLRSLGVFAPRPAAPASFDSLRSPLRGCLSAVYVGFAPVLSPCLRPPGPLRSLGGALRAVVFYKRSVLTCACHLRRSHRSSESDETRCARRRVASRAARMLRGRLSGSTCRSSSSKNWIASTERPASMRSSTLATASRA